MGLHYLLIFFYAWIFVEKFFFDDPSLVDKAPSAYLSHKEVYENSVKKSTIIVKKIKQLQAEGKDGIDNYM